MSLVSDWSELPHDVLVNIAQLMFSVSAEDIVAMRGVCTSWRAVTKDRFVKFSKSWPSVPLLMLAEDDGDDERKFYSLSKRMVCVRLPLPEIKGKRCIEVRFGWLLTLASSGEVALLNPFSRSQIALPNLQTFPEYEIYECEPMFDFIERAVLSGNPSDTSDFVLVVLTRVYLGFWRHGNHGWRRIEPKAPTFLDLNYFHHKFYAINTCGEIWVWDPSGTEAHMILYVEAVHNSFCQAYLVESAATGDLLLVLRNGNTYSGKPELTYGATRFRIFRIDVRRGVCNEINSFVEDAIFVGHNTAISIVASEFPGVIKPNRIYFSDDSIEAYHLDAEDYLRNYLMEEESESESEDDEGGVVWPNFADGPVIRLRGWKDDEWNKIGNSCAGKGGGKDMGVYNLEDGGIERFGEEAETVSFTYPPLWIAPSSFSWCS